MLTQTQELVSLLCSFLVYLSLNHFFIWRDTTRLNFNLVIAFDEQNMLQTNGIQNSLKGLPQISLNYFWNRCVNCDMVCGLDANQIKDTCGKHFFLWKGKKHQVWVAVATLHSKRRQVLCLKGTHLSHLKASFCMMNVDRALARGVSNYLSL